MARELIRAGLLHQAAERYNTVQITDAGLAALRDRRTIQLTRPIVEKAAERGGGRRGRGRTGGDALAATVPTPVAGGKRRAARLGGIECDEELFEKLRGLRKALADRRGVPPYIVFGDSTLRLMALHKPQDDAAMLALSGVGERKLADYGPAFLDAIRAHIRGDGTEAAAVDP